jgi:hypothetical protein
MNRLDDHELAAKLLQDHFAATSALMAFMLKNLPGEVRTRTFDAVRNGTGKVARGVERDGAHACADGWVGAALVGADRGLKCSGVRSW